MPVIRFVLRFAIPRMYWYAFADPEKGSVDPSISAADLADIRAGKVIEQVRDYPFVGRTMDDLNNGTIQNILKAALVTVWETAQAEITAQFSSWALHGHRYTDAAVWEAPPAT